MLRLVAFTLLLILAAVKFSHADETRVEQKLVVVKNDASYLMQGDPYINSTNKPANYHRNSVLPFFLAEGWVIKSIHVNEKSREDNLYGYVVIERNK